MPAESSGGKAQGAFLTIGELADDLGLPTHILRYWETRFAQLKPLKRSGNRRYYRPDDVALAQRINRLLNVEGFTIDGAKRALQSKPENDPVAFVQPAMASNDPAIVAGLRAIRDRLAGALAAA